MECWTVMTVSIEEKSRQRATLSMIYTTVDCKLDMKNGRARLVQ